ncbi:hypothetical protein GCM10027347_54210 [Larkinella harenae]
MRKNKLPVRFTGQHFTVDNLLIADAITIANLQQTDTVLDIGAGTGNVTTHLIHCCKSIIAIENDKALVGILRKKFARYSSVHIVDADIRHYAYPSTRFKVVSNIPYGLTADILKALLFDRVMCFMGGSLVIQLEPAKKLVAEKVYNPYTVFYRTFFDIKLMCELPPQCFMPPPTVKSALLAIKKRESPIGFQHKEKYLTFLSSLLREPELAIHTALKRIFRKSQVRDLANKYGLKLESPVVALSIPQWEGCFLTMIEKVPQKFHPGDRLPNGF